MSGTDLKPVRSPSGEPTLHNDGTVSWRDWGQWHRTPYTRVAPSVIPWLEPGPVRDLLAAACLARNWPVNISHDWETLDEYHRRGLG